VSELFADVLVREYRDWARQCYPREMCGLVVRVLGGALTFFRADNIAASPADHFVIRPMDWAFAEDTGEVVAIVHSHPDESANPSAGDRVMCSRTGVPWIIVGWPSGVLVTCEPGAKTPPPLLGREFAHGVLDCYALVRDYFALELGLELPEFARTDRWWERGEDLYLQHFRDAGFVPVDDGPREHDGILMQVLSDQVNHAGVYLAGGLMLHHLWGRLSCREPYGGYWHRHTRLVVRHRSLCDAA